MKEIIKHTVDVAKTLGEYVVYQLRMIESVYPDDTFKPIQPAAIYMPEEHHEL